jgi:acyl carrier protein
MNTQIYILDPTREPVPIGVTGEIYVGGAGVARGYLNRPSLTAERFIASPFIAGGRLYKTGDLGRYLADGNIEFLGRSDLQVKIRGFRIELGEIEARLAEHPQVREAVVLAREDQADDKRLVAYYTCAEINETPDVVELREHLLALLPPYMVPAAYVRLEKLPLTPSGKLDRKQLPAPDSSAYVSHIYESPQGPIEEEIAAIWAEVLGIDRIGRHDNFFDLGGHSLLAVRLVAQISLAMEARLSLEDVFLKPTVSSMSELIMMMRLLSDAEVKITSSPSRDGIEGMI